MEIIIIVFLGLVGLVWGIAKIQQNADKKRRRLEDAARDNEIMREWFEKEIEERKGKK